MNQIVEARRSDKNELVEKIDRLLGLRPEANESRSTFKISDLAREFDVTLRTLRFYEDRGLLNPQRRGTTRLYTRRDRMRLRLIQLAKTLGFSLTEAKQMIDIYDEPNGKRRQLETALERMVDQRKVLLSQRAEVEHALKAIDASLEIVQSALGKRSR